MRGAAKAGSLNQTNLGALKAETNLWVRNQAKPKLGLALELERDLHLRAISFDFPVFELHIKLHDFCNPKVSQ